VSTKSVMGMTATGRRRNRSWPEALKREIVAASFAPGASVSVVARRYDVNANQYFPGGSAIAMFRLPRPSKRLRDSSP
jgi:transposase